MESEHTQNRPDRPTLRTIEEWEQARVRIDELIPGKLYISGFPDHIAELVEELQPGLIISSSLEPPTVTAGAKVLRYPFLDDWLNPPPTRDLWKIADFAAKWAKQNDKPILVHCAYGLNRSALVAGFILKKMTGLAGPEIVELMRTQRPPVLNNSTFHTMVNGL